MKSILTIFLAMMAFFAAESSTAVNKLDFTTVDMLTNRFYQEKKWDSVIMIGKQALRQDIDYYYLRVRLGISYFEKAQYLPAITHLKKARQFNSGDPKVGDYLYRAYFYTNRDEDAHLLRATMPREDQDTTLSLPGLIGQVHFESGYTLSSDRNPGNLSTMSGHDSIYGERDLYGNSFYTNLGLKLRASNTVGLTLACNYLNFSKTKYIQYGRAEDHLQNVADSAWGKSYNYTFPWVIHDTSFSYHVSQAEAYTGASIALPWGLKVMPAVHWIHVSYNMINPGFRRDTVRDTAFYTAFDHIYHTFPFTRIIYSFDRKDTSFNNWVLALRVSKDLGRINVALSGSWSNLNGKAQKQAGIALTYYPMGNLNYYGTTMAISFFQDNDKRLLLSQVLGAKITRWMWGEANFYYGDYTNANIFNGSVVYNNSDMIDFRGGATLLFIINKHIQLSLIYQYFRKESQQLYYTRVQNPETHAITEIPQTKNNPYNTNTLIGGITWKL